MVQERQTFGSRAIPAACLSPTCAVVGQSLCVAAKAQGSAQYATTYLQKSSDAALMRMGCHINSSTYYTYYLVLSTRYLVPKVKPLRLNS